MFDSLKVVMDFFTLEFAARHTAKAGSASPSSRDQQQQQGTPRGEAHAGGDRGALLASSNTPSDGSSSSSAPCGGGWLERAPVSPLQATLMFVSLSPGEMPPLDVLEPYYRVLQPALGTELCAAASATASAPAAAGACEAAVAKAAAAGAAVSPPSDVSTTTGDGRGSRCELSEALVCLDTDGSGTVEFDELLAASMTSADFREREPACR